MENRAKFNLKLFGGFKLTDSKGQVVDPEARKAKALFAWLAVNPNLEHPREKLAALFWPDSEEVGARHSLRQALASLRKVMPDETSPVRASKDAILFDSARIEVDALKFDAALANGQIQAADTISQLYQGELLAGCNPRADLFDEWLADHRHHYRERATNAMCQSLSMLIDKRRFKQAVPLAMRLINIDPLRESAYRGLMMAHMALGNNALALRWYRRCERTLLKDLGVLPCLETRALHVQLLTAWDEADTDKSKQQAHIKAKKRALKLISKGHQRVLYQAESAIEGIFDHLGGQGLLLRSESAEAINTLLDQIIELAEPQGFRLCRGEIGNPGGEQPGNQAALTSCSLISVCTVSPVGSAPATVHDLDQQLEACISSVNSASEVSPVLLVLENIHAAGARTLDLLGRLISVVGKASVLLVMTTRFGGEAREKAWQGALLNTPLTTIDIA